MSLLREIKPKSARIARILKKREPQPVEPPKQTLLLHGPKCPQPLQSLLTVLSQVTAPHSTHLHKKNKDIHPFETAGQESLEFLASKNECGLWVFGSHNKKRPLTLTVGRIFGGKVLEMGELGLIGPEAGTTPDSGSDGRRGNAPKLEIPVGVDPMIVFSGSVWEGSEATTGSGYGTNVYGMWKSLLLDLFRSEPSSKVDVEGLRFLLQIAAGEPDPSQPSLNPTIHLRWYSIRTLKSGQKVPRVEVTPMGPKYDFRIGRYKMPDEAMWKVAIKKSPGQESKEGRGKKKNIAMDAVGDKLGRVHLGRQDLGMLQTRKMKGLKRGGRNAEDDDPIDGANGMDDENRRAKKAKI